MCVIPHHDVVILVKEPIEKPHGGAEGKKQGQGKWHVLYTSGFDDLSLQFMWEIFKCCYYMHKKNKMLINRDNQHANLHVKLYKMNGESRKYHDA